MAVKESQMITWTLESNEEGKWALFLRVGGVVQQMTNWLETREQVVETMKVKLQLA